MTLDTSMGGLGRPEPYEHAKLTQPLLIFSNGNSAPRPRHIAERVAHFVRVAALEHCVEISGDGFVAVEELGDVPAGSLKAHAQAAFRTSRPISASFACSACPENSRPFG